jgi:Uma2 family endonuclease
MSAILKPRYTLEEYFELERTSEEKYEYFNGEVFCMSGVQRNHAQIEGNLMTTFKNRLSGRGCHVYGASLRVKTPSLAPYRYPDLSIVCDAPQFEQISGLDTLTNPVLIIEILSPSTEAFDRGDKFTHYKSIPAFREYLLVAQHRPHVTHYVRKDDDKWEYEEFNDLAATIYLPTVDSNLSLADIYLNVEFPPTVSLPIIDTAQLP